jgi:hypothetical protein
VEFRWRWYFGEIWVCGGGCCAHWCIPQREPDRGLLVLWLQLQVEGLFIARSEIKTRGELLLSWEGCSLRGLAVLFLSIGGGKGIGRVSLLLGKDRR